MTEEKKQTQETAPEEATPAKSGGLGGMIKYALFGVAGLVLIAGIAFGTLMFLGGDTAETNDDSEATAEVTEAESAKPESHAAVANSEAEKSDESGLNEDSLLELLDQDESVMEELLANIEVLDFVPDEDATDPVDLGMSVEDSIESSQWLKKEEKRLADWETTLDTREKELNVRESKVQKQILRIEQAESSRIATLAKLYDGMDPAAVARLAANLDDATVVALLPRMKLKSASAVLALMPPNRAASLSKQMITIAEN